MSTNLGRTQPSAGDSAVLDDEQAVRVLFDSVTEAWAANDIDHFVSHYTDEATATLPGFHLPSKAALHKSMGMAFAGPFKGSQRIHQVQKVRFLNEDTAIVITRSATQFPGETEPAADQWSMATWVLTRHDGTWLIEAYHDCPAG